MMKRIIELDVREFEHPVPLEMALERFSRLEGSAVLHMIHRKNPLPLFEILVRQGGYYHSFQDEAEVWHIMITKDPSVDLETVDV